MMNDIAELYDTLIDKTRARRLSWTEGPGQGALTTRVGQLTIRVTGLILTGRTANLKNPFSATTIAGSQEINVYNEELELVANGFYPKKSHFRNAMTTMSSLGGEDISHPKLSELFAVLEERYRRSSIAAELLTALKTA